jgi:hypothetical protein
VTASQALIGGGLGILAGILWAAQDPGVFAKLLGLASGRIDDGFSPHRRRTLSDVIAEEMAGGLKPPTELPPLKPPGDPDAPLDLDRQVAPESPRAPDDAEIRARLARAEMELKDARWRIRTLQEENGGLQQELAVANAKGSQEVGVLRLRLQEVEATSVSRRPSGRPRPARPSGCPRLPCPPPRRVRRIAASRMPSEPSPAASTPTSSMPPAWNERCGSIFSKSSGAIWSGSSAVRTRRAADGRPATVTTNRCLKFQPTGGVLALPGRRPRAGSRRSWPPALQ